VLITTIEQLAGKRVWVSEYAYCFACHNELWRDGFVVERDDNLDNVLERCFNQQYECRAGSRGGKVCSQSTDYNTELVETVRLSVAGHPGRGGLFITGNGEVSGEIDILEHSTMDDAELVSA